ncbi:hypothetical protein ACX80E_04950 [Arthrobacter sp. TMN-49]
MHSDPGAGTPHPGGTDDEVWRDLVARLEEAEDSFLSAPEEPGTPSGGPDAKGVTDFDPLGVWQRQAASAEPPMGPRDYVAADDEDFVPEELPSLANAEPAIMLSWIGAAGGPIFLVIAAIFWRQIPTMLVIAVVAAFLAGTGYLLYRLPNHRDHDSGDGAVV